MRFFCALSSVIHLDTGKNDKNISQINDKPDCDYHAEAIINLYGQPDLHQGGCYEIVDYNAHGDERQIAYLFDNSDHADATVDFARVGGSCHSCYVVNQHYRHKDDNGNEQNVEIFGERFDGSRE